MLCSAAQYQVVHQVQLSDILRTKVAENVLLEIDRDTCEHEPTKQPISIHTARSCGTPPALSSTLRLSSENCGKLSMRM